MLLDNIFKLPFRLYKKVKKLIFSNNSTGRNDLLQLGEQEFMRISKLERYRYDETSLDGRKFKFVDSCTFLGSLHEIFATEIYKFIPGDDPVVILDCGANIGLATLYFKMQFPLAHIIAYEPDPNIFSVMRENISSFGYEDIVLKNEAISNKEGEIHFQLEGGHSGMIVQENNGDNVISVKATRLKFVLQQFDTITFLKMDIEGHEIDVIPDISDELRRVRFFFLEYHSFLGQDQKLDEILSIIKNAGFRYYLREACQKPFPFITKELFLGMDFLVNIFCFRD